MERFFATIKCHEYQIVFLVWSFNNKSNTDIRPAEELQNLKTFPFDDRDLVLIRMRNVKLFIKKKIKNLNLERKKNVINSVECSRKNIHHRI